MTKLSTILEWATNKEDLQDKTVLNSNPSDGEIKAFNEVCNKVMRLLKNSKIVSKDHLHTEDTSNSLFSTSMIRKSTLTQHLGEYDGDDFPGFMKKLAETFQKAKFKVRKGYGIDEIKGYEVINKDNEIIGEIDFLEKGSVPKLGNLVIFKHKKTMNKGDLKEIIRREIISAINEGKKKKKKQFEGISVEESGHVETNEVGNFWIATGPAKGDTNESKGKKKQNYFETDVFNFAEKVKSGQIALENIKGIFRKESGARRLSEKLIQEREAAVLEATNKANDLKSRLEGIKKEVGEFKKTKTETKQAVAALKNSPNPAKNPAEPYVKPAVKSFDQKTNTVKR